ncbi:cysteine hydrolase family protein [Mitsuokella sp. AF21-1AC]|uniref:cysteine hydrolase family protein n=1 Tax=Mitsuokella sp. AF21-1AC TaxID=2292235 RepID=UPI000E4AE5F5|nr:isochorismatase family cysteine hydrolase [Mitsuokella sp. AF21-1AC]RGS72150.1 cysteine hydrolase [Mitsuokella sp. AF21-1AC]
MKKCIVVIDMQKDFIDGSLGTPEAQALLPRLLAYVQQAKDAGAALAFTLDTHGADYLSTQEGRKLPVPHCIKPEAGWQLAEELQPLAKEAVAVVEKPAFGSLELPKHLAAYDEIELVGLCTDICVIANAMILKAAFPEKTIAVKADCCAGVTPASHECALAAMQACQVDIR